ncbi:MdtA/MuxA family multidrug efflux RND transporter periplasmic adaptor subunit [Methylomonas sp. AM2-LC]|uniref:MdtA/MuxA family multidrug efflux RND transporter periplasmic adaptor subunit n=1 Tax=Methylomonas sp. AM2-LC TaxID=3153301 RepID=UPI003267A891
MNQTKNKPYGHSGKRIVSLGLLVTIIAGGVYVYQNNQPTVAETKTALTDKSDKHKRRSGRDHFHDEDEAVVVAVETAIQGDYPIFLNCLGTVTALKTVTVHSRVDGELKNIVFTEGQMIKEGDLLAEIDPRPFAILQKQAEGQLLKDEALLKNAELDYRRYQTLLEQESIAAQQTATQAALITQYQGVVEIDKSQLDNAKLQLNYAKLTAPITGRVGLRQIDQGNIIHASDSNGLVVITQMQPISVVFTLPEDKVQPLIKRLRTHQTIPIEAYDRAGTNKLADGKLTAIDNQIDPTTGTLKLKAQFDNTESTLFANQFVNIKMLLDTLTGVTLIPSAALQQDTQGPYVYVINSDKKAELRHISLAPGTSAQDKVAVLNNLAANEVVVIEGIDRLKEGSKIDIAQKDGLALAENTETSSALPQEKKNHQSRRKE